MKLIIVGLLLTIFVLIRSAPTVHDARANVERAADQYSQHVR